LAQFVEVPVAQLSEDALSGLLEEFASRDGTDYGERERSLEEKCANLRSGLTRRDLVLLFDAESAQWDVLERTKAAELLGGRE
jgi:uncharacterized protein YheU (UPF0270 family)